MEQREESIKVSADGNAETQQVEDPSTAPPLPQGKSKEALSKVIGIGGCSNLIEYTPEGSPTSSLLLARVKEVIGVPTPPKWQTDNLGSLKQVIEFFEGVILRRTLRPVNSILTFKMPVMDSSEEVSRFIGPLYFVGQVLKVSPDQIIDPQTHSKIYSKLRQLAQKNLILIESTQIYQNRLKPIILPIKKEFENRIYVEILRESKKVSKGAAEDEDRLPNSSTSNRVQRRVNKLALTKFGPTILLSDPDDPLTPKVGIDTLSTPRVQILIFLLLDQVQDTLDAGCDLLSSSESNLRAELKSVSRVISNYSGDLRRIRTEMNFRASVCSPDLQEALIMLQTQINDITHLLDTVTEMTHWSILAFNGLLNLCPLTKGIPRKLPEVDKVLKRSSRRKTCSVMEFDETFSKVFRSDSDFTDTFQILVNLSKWDQQLLLLPGPEEALEPGEANHQLGPLSKGGFEEVQDETGIAPSKGTQTLNIREFPPLMLFTPQKEEGSFLQETSDESSHPGLSSPSDLAQKGIKESQNELDQNGVKVIPETSMF